MPVDRYGKHGRFHLIPEGEVPCVWMEAGVVLGKLCDMGRECESCPFDRVMRGVGRPSGGVAGFIVPEQMYFHRGHTWAEVESGEVVRVGVDDFAQRLVGEVEGVNLPRLGAELRQGERGWSVYSGEWLEMLSPVDGEVVEVNEGLMSEPGLINRDPYGRGWVARVRCARLAANLKNLLRGRLARRWMEGEVEELFSRSSRGLGVVLGDGGLPVNGGLAKQLDSEHWDTIAREFLLTKD